MSKVLLRYQFIFDPSDTAIIQVGQFNEFLSKAFNAIKLDVEIIEEPGDNLTNEIKLFLKPQPEEPTPPAPKQTKPAQILRTMSRRRGFDGRLKKDNG